MAVAADERAVKADLAHLKRRNGGELCREEVLLNYAVAIVEDAHNRKLYPVAALVGIGNAADQDIESLACYALLHGFFHLFLSKVRQKIGYDKLRIGGIVTDGDVNDFAGLKRYNAVQLKRYGHPLVFLYAAVVMCLEIRKLVAFVQGVLLEVDARRVDMRAGYHNALFEALFSYDGQHQRLAAIVAVDLIAGLELHTVGILDKALSLGHFYGHLYGLALGARLV